MRDPVVESPNRPQHRLLISPLKSLHSDQSVDARLNALESCLSWVYIRLLLLMGASWAIQAAELVLLIFTRVIVADDIGMGEQALEIFGASILMGSVAGGPIFGHVADAFGRRKALLLAMVLSVGGLAVSAQAEAEYVLIIGRVVTGLGFGGQFSSTLVLLQELVPRSMRGRVVSLLDAFTGLGGMVGVGLAFAVEPWLKWRTTYMLVCSFVLYTVVLHFTIPESPRWLASVGRMEEAYAAVEKIERLHHLQPPSDDIPKIVLGFKSVFAPLPSSTIRPSSCKQMTPILSLLTLWIAITLSSYTLGIYVPTLIGLEGFNMFKSWSTVALVSAAQVLGSVVAALVLDTYGPQRSLSCFATMAAITSVVLSYVPWSPAFVITGSFLVTSLLSGCWSCVLSYSPGHFTTARRGRGMGYAVGASRLVATGICYMYNHWALSVAALCWIFGGLLMVVAVGVVPYFGHNPDKEDDTGS
ncbi:hypothetical protein PRIC1_011414 [Phytophthora ramorum]